MQFFENCIILYDTHEDMPDFLTQKRKKKGVERNKRATEIKESEEHRNYMPSAIRTAKIHATSARKLNQKQFHNQC